MKRSYAALKNEFDDGQAIKKRAVIQLINCTASGQKRMFSRWVTLTEKSKTFNECKLVFRCCMLWSLVVLASFVVSCLFCVL